MSNCLTNHVAQYVVGIAEPPEHGMHGEHKVENHTLSHRYVDAVMAERADIINDH